MNFLKKKFDYFSILISLFFLIYLIYKSEIIFEGTNRGYYLKYYVLCILFLFVSFFALKISKSFNIIFN